MVIWKCRTCGVSITVAENVTPKFCCACGGDNLTCTSRLATYEAYDKELDSIVSELNALYDSMKPLHKRYTYIMQYFRQQKKRGLITEDEYRQRAEKFAGLHKRRRLANGQ